MLHDATLKSFRIACARILATLVLAGFVGKATPPRAGGQPYVKER